MTFYLFADIIVDMNLDSQCCFKPEGISRRLNLAGVDPFFRSRFVNHFGRKKHVTPSKHIHIRRHLFYLLDYVTRRSENWDLQKRTACNCRSEKIQLV